MSPLLKTEEVIFKTLNNAGTIILNRPKYLNTLNLPMVMQILPKLQTWEKSKKLVIIKGKTGKTFCAGGDMRQSFIDKEKGVLNNEFMFYEYNLNHAIKSYSIPYVALIDGITMGAGLGLSVHGSYRIATENTIIAMPETKIGFLPDVGASFFLSRLPYHVGIYLGLTSNTLSGKEVAAVGIATHFVSSHRLLTLEESLSHCVSDLDVKNTLHTFREPVEELLDLMPRVKDIDYCFSAKTVEDIINRLMLIDNEWSAQIIKTLRQRCPLSLKLTLSALTRGLQLNLWQCLQMEYRICTRLMAGPNCTEGVRALLIDRDNDPQWVPKTLDEVNERDIEPYFETLPIRELRYLGSNSKL